MLPAEAAAEPAVVRKIVIHLREVMGGRGRGRRKPRIVVEQPGSSRRRVKFRQCLRNAAEAAGRDYIVRERLVVSWIVDRVAQLGEISAALL